MANETYSLKAEPRELTGKKVARLRRDGRIPAVLYGHGVKPLPLTVAQGELEKVYRQAGGSSVVKVELADGARNVLIQDVQDDPTTGHHLHADFFQVRMDEKIKATVPLEFEGTPPAVRELDGVLITNLTELEVECLPADLPPQLTVDIGSLATFEDAITVADLPVPAAVTVLTEPETNVAAVTPPRTEEEMAELDEPVEEAPEPEDAVEGEEGEEGAEGKGEEGGAEGGEASEGSTDDASGGKPEGKSEKG